MTSILPAGQGWADGPEISPLFGAYWKATRIDDEIHRLSKLVPGESPPEPTDLGGQVRILFAGLGVASVRLDDDLRIAIKEALHVFCRALLRLRELQTVQPHGGLGFSS